jgi:dihydrofolate reductase
MFIAAMQVSVDGRFEGPNGEMDWIGTWEDPFAILPGVEACVLGGRMYPDYERFWSGVRESRGAASPFTGKVASEAEAEYARLSASIPHFVLSRRLGGAAWPNTTLLRDVDAVRALREQARGDVYVVGGGELVRTLLDERLLDELRLVVHPVVLGGGPPFLGGAAGPRELSLVDVQSLRLDAVRLVYRARHMA